MGTIKKILITGATGFIGRALVSAVVFSRNYQCIIALFQKQHRQIFPKRILRKCTFFVVGDICSKINWKEILKDVDIVIHLAARVHITNETVKDPLAAFRRVNVKGTEKLVKESVIAGVKKFIFMSSLALHVGDYGADYSIPFNENNICHPSSPYAVSKWEAEQYLNDVAKKTNMKIVIIRPPLVYGPDVKANFLNLLKLTKTGLPMPVGALYSKRSMVSLNNLVDFIMHCITCPSAANETFFVSDDNDISTKELFTKLILLFGKRPLLLPIPSKILYNLGILLRKRKVIDRLCSPLQVDITKAKTLLDWKPIQTLEEGLKETVEWYKQKCL